MWISLNLSLLILLINSDIISARSRVSRKSSRCLKYSKESKRPDFSDPAKRVNEIKCLEYTWQAKHNIDRDRLKIICDREYGIAGGKSTMITKFPHMAALGWMTKDDNWSFLCGGSLISRHFVLTAAHCTKTKSRELKDSHPRIVRMGVTKIYKESSLYEKPLDKKILKIIIHPYYESPKKYYDIALIKIEKVTRFTKYVHPACLHNTRAMDITKHPLGATGWGLTNTKKSSPVLQSAVLDIVDWHECKDLYNRNWGGFADHQSCAGKLDGSAGTCNGDSGTPLQYRKGNQSDDTNMNVIVAITSFGRKCDLHLQPLGVYVNINYFIDWIESHVWPEDEKYIFPI